MMLRDIWPGRYRGGKANYFIIIDNLLSLFIIGCHCLFHGSNPVVPTMYYSILFNN
jgi:hypothetical protein